jgi:hypothetical protein
VAFLERNGISVLIAYVQEVSGNILGFALTTLEALMHHHVGWDKLDETFLQNIIPFISSSNLTASRRAIEIVSHLVKSPQHGFDAIDRAIRANATKETKKPYFVLVRLLASTDLNVKLAALTLVGELINSTPSDQHKKQFLHLLDDLGINKLLKVWPPLPPHSLSLSHHRSLSLSIVRTTAGASHDDPEPELQGAALPLPARPTRGAAAAERHCPRQGE